jgi:hypothetical protein
MQPAAVRRTASFLQPAVSFFAQVARTNRVALKKRAFRPALISV